ncbi:hypothetical protein AVEN_52829-1 [Araneus ventricosus]|uniref:Uncharacterized protein n=1 Tax=Araneus ventricosus TaxID=182803 RepID=A0A4Y2VMB6_ARAVE|nr:hypothetical protein AVEN_52829-1 [Araneus ventricosus]
MGKEQAHLEPLIIACQSPMEGLWNTLWFADLILQVRAKRRSTLEHAPTGTENPHTDKLILMSEWCACPFPMVCVGLSKNTFFERSIRRFANLRKLLRTYKKACLSGFVLTVTESLFCSVRSHVNTYTLKLE